MEHLPRFLTTHKAVGETPLMAIERVRLEHHIPHGVPLAYAGRLDPMASGVLLVLVGDECKVQSKYHALDKTYEFEILFGITSDTGDVLGHVITHPHTTVDAVALSRVCRSLTGPISLPYPHFSAKTVKGKPLHEWTLEGRLDEIAIPVQHSTVYTLALENLRSVPARELYDDVMKKIATIPTVTDARKALGADFRRASVREHWERVRRESGDATVFQIATMRATVSSGTYIRSLAPLIAERVGTHGLAYAIHRTRIGRFVKYGPLTWWTRVYR